MIISGIDLREIVENELGRPLNHGGKAWMFHCPFHHEQHGYSLAVYKDGWRCYGACADFGDALDWMQRRHGLSYSQAREALNVPLDVSSREGDALRASERPEATAPADSWRERAQQFAHYARSLLWRPSGTRALRYLRARGLNDETIEAALLGYWPGAYTQSRPCNGLYVPCGIVIPWRRDGLTWSLQVRRAAGEPKYKLVKDGGKGGLYGVDGLSAFPDTTLLSEGEFDTMVVAQECSWLHALTLGSASMRLPLLWRERLLSCSRVLVATDNDKAGDKAAMALLSDLPNAVRVKLPQGVKDLGALHLQGQGVLRDYLAAYR